MSSLLFSETREDQLSEVTGNQTHSKTHPSSDENFFHILHLAQFDLGSHK